MFVVELFYTFISNIDIDIDIVNITKHITLRKTIKFIIEGKDYK